MDSIGEEIFGMIPKPKSMSITNWPSIIYPCLNPKKSSSDRTSDQPWDGGCIYLDLYECFGIEKKHIQDSWILLLMAEILHQLTCSLSQFIPLFTRFYISQLVQDFSHQPYGYINSKGQTSSSKCLWSSKCQDWPSIIHPCLNPKKFINWQNLGSTVGRWMHLPRFVRVFWD